MNYLLVALAFASLLLSSCERAPDFEKEVRILESKMVKPHWAPSDRQVIKRQGFSPEHYVIFYQDPRHKDSRLDSHSITHSGRGGQNTIEVYGPSRNYLKSTVLLERDAGQGLSYTIQLSGCNFEDSESYLFSLVNVAGYTDGYQPSSKLSYDPKARQLTLELAEQRKEECFTSSLYFEVITKENKLTLKPITPPKTGTNAL